MAPETPSSLPPSLGYILCVIPGTVNLIFALPFGFLVLPSESFFLVHESSFSKTLWLFPVFHWSLFRQTKITSTDLYDMMPSLPQPPAENFSLYFSSLEFLELLYSALTSFISFGKCQPFFCCISFAPFSLSLLFQNFSYTCYDIQYLIYPFLYFSFFVLFLFLDVLSSPLFQFLAIHTSEQQGEQQQWHVWSLEKQHCCPPVGLLEMQALRPHPIPDLLSHSSSPHDLSVH